MQRARVRQLSWPDWSAGFLCNRHQVIQGELQATTVSNGFHVAAGQLIQLTVKSFACVCITVTYQTCYKRDKAGGPSATAQAKFSKCTELLDAGLLVLSRWNGGCSVSVWVKINLMNDNNLHFCSSTCWPGGGLLLRLLLPGVLSSSGSK